MTQVKNGDTVHLHYKGTLNDGTVFDSSEGREPLSFVVGAGHIIPGLDSALPGMSIGDKKTVTVPSDQAYGPVNPAMRQAIPRAEIPGNIPTEVGTQLQMQTQTGEVIPVVIVDADDATITLDANHPLAGKDLTFAIELVSIKPAA